MEGVNHESMIESVASDKDAQSAMNNRSQTVSEDEGDQRVSQDSEHEDNTPMLEESSVPEDHPYPRLCVPIEVTADYVVTFSAIEV